MSPTDIGYFIKPFVFLDFFEARPQNAPVFGYHPHSGIATCTVILNGAVEYEESSGARGTIPAGGVEWMRAGNGIWHRGGMTGTEPVKGFQLWLALPADLENGPPASQYLGPESFTNAGPARVMLGSLEAVHSQIATPPGITYLDVYLRSGESWTFTPAAEHTVAWIAVHKGSVEVGNERVSKGEFVAFAEGSEHLNFTAREDAGFVLGAAVKHPHELHCGYYSVHTSPEALQRGENRIAELGTALQRAGILR